MTGNTYQNDFFFVSLSFVQTKIFSSLSKLRPKISEIRLETAVPCFAVVEFDSILARFDFFGLEIPKI